MNKKIDCLLVAFSGIEQSSAQEHIDKEGCDVKLRPFFNGAIAYLGSYLNARSLNFDYVCSCEEQIETLENKLLQDIGIIAISTTFVLDVERIISLIKWIRVKKPHCRIVIGGSFITYTISQYSIVEREILMRGIGAEYFICSYFRRKSVGRTGSCYKKERL